MTAILNRLADLGIQLPDAPKPVASYVPGRVVGNQLYVSGQLPFDDGRLLATGPVPSATTIEEATLAAKSCGVNGLAVAADVLGHELDRIKSVVRVGVFVQSDDRFDAQPKVANGVSDLMIEIFGEAGKHVRAAVGVNALPLDASVEVEFIFEIG
ncbi:MAG: RidA family protein [Phycisphaera sp.]|nr:RidA family protein [Phycisphaera sp.]